VGVIARRYGASPLHLLAHLAVLAFCAWALLRVLDAGRPLDVLVWLVGAVVLHDLVLLPFYGALDRIAAVATRPLVVRGRGRSPVPVVNHLRVPAGIAGLLFLVHFPVILDREGAFLRVAGVGWDGYAERWLLACAVLFGGSLLVYLVRVARARSRA
jgi:hypothetical protein